MAYRFNYDSARIFNDELIEYINQLRQENKQLKDGWQQEVKNKDEILNRWLELQQRIDKAIEYIEKETKRYEFDINPNIIVEGSWLYDLLKVAEILKGDSNE